MKKISELMKELSHGPEDEIELNAWEMKDEIRRLIIDNIKELRNNILEIAKCLEKRNEPPMIRVSEQNDDLLIETAVRTDKLCGQKYHQIRILKEIFEITEEDLK